MLKRSKNVSNPGDPGWSVFLITGVPAVGKTTLANKLAERISPLEVITFRELILTIKAADRPITHSELRRHPTREATMSTIEKAVELLISRVNELRARTNVLIDSHAVAKDEYGFRVSPDNISVLNRIGLRAIFVLHGDHNTIIRRLKSDASGRRLVTRAEISVHERLQDSVAISYAVASGCPVFFVNTTELDVGIDNILKILDSLGVSYTRA